MRPLPFIKVQCDWDVVIKEAKGNSSSTDNLRFWVSSYGGESSGVHGRMDVARDDAGSIRVEPDDSKECKTSTEFTVDVVDEACLRVKSVSTGAHSLVHAPSHRWPTIHPDGEEGPRHVLAVDVTKDGKHGVSGSTAAMLRVWDTNTGIPFAELNGHHGDVNVAKWFPNGKVVLSSAGDLTLKIWSAEIGRCAKTLTGHSRVVTDACFVGNGSTFVTSAKDGTVKLWDCAKGEVSSHLDLLDPINRVLVLEDGGHVLLACGEDGRVLLQDLRQAEKSGMYVCQSAINAVVRVAPQAVVVGTQEGAMPLLDLRKLDKPVSVVSKSTAPIYELAEATPEQVAGALAARGGGGDGASSPFFWATNGEGDCSLLRHGEGEQAGLVVSELTGVDCEPVYDMCSVASQIFTASRDGVMVFEVPTS